MLTENLESNNSFLWRQLTVSESSPNPFFLSTKCPPAWAFAVTACLDYFRFARHPTGIADSTLPSLWSNADFRRANIDTLRRRLYNPLPRGGVAAEQVVSALRSEERRVGKEGRS